MTALAPAGAAGAAPAVVSRLPSGLRVVTEWVPGVRSVALGVWTGVGSRNETPSQAGAAHYLEHLLFKGTSSRTAARIAEEMDAVGGELNAFTAKEHTCFYAHVLDEDLPLAVELLADVLTDASMTSPDVELERSVVLEEIAMRADDPEDLLGELFDQALLGPHPLARPVLGSEESITAMTRERLHGFWRQHYVPARMVVAAAGNLEHDRVLALVDAAFGAGEGPTGPADPLERVEPVGRGGVMLHGQDTEQAHLMVGTLGLDRHDPRRFALGVLNTALGGGMSSRLFQQVREQRGLAYSVYSATAGYADAGELVVYAGCQPNRLGEVVALTRDILEALRRDGLSEDELSRAKGALRGGLVLGLEDTGSRMQRLGQHQLDYGRHPTLGESLDRIAAVTVEQVAEVAAEVLARPLTAAVIGPYDGVDELPAALRELAG